MISIDIETTGLDPGTHQILEFAAVLENGDTFQMVIKHETYVIDAYCLKLHKELLKECIGHGTPIGSLGSAFRRWLKKNDVKVPYHVVGANFGGFDGCFLKKVPNFPPWHYGVLEIGSLYFDGSLPRRLKDIEPIDNPHRALPDAEAVMRAYKRKMDIGSNHQHSNGGGWVDNTATVDASVYVGSNATVKGKAKVQGNVRLFHNACVNDTAHVWGNVIIRDNAKVSDRARVGGNSIIAGNVFVGDDAVVNGDVCLSGQVSVTCYGNVTGNITFSGSENITK